MIDETPPVDAYEGDELARGTRVPPQDIDSEESVLGSILLKNTALYEITYLTPGDFYREKHRKIFAAMKALHAVQEPIDLVTLGTALKDAGDLAIVGGEAFLAYLAGRVPTASNVTYYAAVVRGRALARATIDLCTETAAAAYDVASKEEKKLLNGHQQKVLEIIVGANWNKTVTSRQAVQIATKNYEKAAENNKAQISGAGISTGLTKLDRAMGKMLPGRLYTFGGDSGDGKSILLHQLKRAAALAGFPVTFYSIEMGADECVNRDIAAMGEVPNEKLMFAQLSAVPDGDRESELDRYFSAAADVGALGVRYIDDPSIGWDELIALFRSHVASAKMEHGLFILDYVSALARRNQSKFNDEFKLLRQYSGGLKDLARETGWTVITASQVSTEFSKRAAEMVRQGKSRPSPTSSDLFGGKVLYHDSDVLAILDPMVEDGKKTGTTKLTFHKNRMFKTLSPAYLAEDFDFMRFLDNPRDELQFRNDSQGYLPEPQTELLDKHGNKMGF